MRIVSVELYQIITILCRKYGDGVVVVFVCNRASGERRCYSVVVIPSGREYTRHSDTVWFFCKHRFQNNYNWDSKEVFVPKSTECYRDVKLILYKEVSLSYGTYLIFQSLLVDNVSFQCKLLSPVQLHLLCNYILWRKLDSPLCLVLLC